MSYVFSAQEQQLLRDAINQSTGLTPSQTSTPQTFTPKEKAVGTSGLGCKPRHWYRRYISDQGTLLIRGLCCYSKFLSVCK
jgi:hypothetical protein